MRNKVISYNPRLKQFARKLRKNSTLSEILLWKELKTKKSGYEFHRQLPINNYIVDFYCHELKLAIEVDGDSHDNSGTYDIKRQKKLEEFGITFIRFNDIFIKRDMDGVIRILKDKINNMKITSP